MPVSKTRSVLVQVILASIAFCVFIDVSALAGPAADEGPWLGVGISGGASGVRIIEVIRDTPADEAGIRVDDEIVTIAGVRVTTPLELMTEVARHRIAEQVLVTVWRDGEIHRLTVTLRARLSADEIIYRRFVGRPAPAFDLEVVYGSDSGSLRQLSGQVVLLQFFSSSCQDYTNQHTELSRLADEYASQGVVVLAMSVDSSCDVVGWAQRRAPSFNVARDSMGSTARAFQIHDDLPALVVIDRAGIVRYAGIGGAHNLERAVESVEALVRQSRRSR